MASEMSCSEKDSLEGHWERHFDDNHKQHYYFNVRTGQSVWAVPQKSLAKIRVLFVEESEDDPFILHELEFDPKMNVQQLTHKVLSAQLASTPSDEQVDAYGLLLINPPASQHGRWLPNSEQLLCELKLTSHSVFHCVKKGGPLYIIEEQNSEPTMVIIDRTLPVQEIIGLMVGTQLGLEDRFITDFSFKLPDAPFNQWYLQQLSLYEQGIYLQPVVVGKKFYFQDEHLTETDEQVLRLAYNQAKKRFLDDEYFIRAADLVEFVSVLCVAESSKPPVVRLNGLVPERLCSETRLLGQISNRVKELRNEDCSVEKARLTFLQMLEKNSVTYGYTMFSAKYQNRAVAIGIGPKDVSIFEVASRQIVSRIEHSSILKCAATSSRFTLVYFKEAQDNMFHMREELISIVTRSGIQIEHFLEEVLQQYRILHQSSTSFTQQVRGISELIKDPTQLQRAYTENHELRRLYFNQGSLSFLHKGNKARDSSSSEDLTETTPEVSQSERANSVASVRSLGTEADILDDILPEYAWQEEEEIDTDMISSSFGFPNISTLEQEYITNLTRIAAQVRLLEVKKRLLQQKLAVTRVGTYGKSINEVKKTIEQLFASKNVKLEDLRKMVDNQLAKLVIYEDYLNGRYERAARKERHIIQKENDLIQQKLEFLEVQQELTLQANQMQKTKETQLQASAPESTKSKRNNFNLFTFGKKSEPSPKAHDSPPQSALSNSPTIGQKNSPRVDPPPLSLANKVSTPDVTPVQTKVASPVPVAEQIEKRKTFSLFSRNGRANDGKDDQIVKSSPPPKFVKSSSTPDMSNELRERLERQRKKNQI